MSARADGQSVASAPPAISQEQTPFGWMACSTALWLIDESMREWVLINTTLTVNVFCSKEFVRDVKKAQPLVIHINAVTFTVQ
jgi:hypothetical protein